MSDKPAPNPAPQQQKPEAIPESVDFEAIDSLLDVRRNYLIDKKLIEGLTEAETIELRRINDALDGLETEYRRPAMTDLKQIEAFIAKQQETKAVTVADSEWQQLAAWLKSCIEVQQALAEQVTTKEQAYEKEHQKYAFTARTSDVNHQVRAAYDNVLVYVMNEMPEEAKR